MFIKEIKYKYKSDEHQYWHDIPAVKQLDHFEFEKPVTIFVGENGSGKSTIVEAIAVNFGMNPEGGGRNFNFSTRATHAGLHDELVLSKVGFPRDNFFLRAEGFYNVASQIDATTAPSTILKNYGARSVHEQSHGEAFLKTMMHRFYGQGLYILDEPESALSPMKQMSMLAIMHDLVKEGSQFIIATHSPVLMAYPDADIIELTEDGLRRVNYQETEHFQMMHRFVNHPDSLLRHLFTDEE